MMEMNTSARNERYLSMFGMVSDKSMPKIYNGFNLKIINSNGHYFNKLLNERYGTFTFEGILVYFLFNIRLFERDMTYLVVAHYGPNMPINTQTTSSLICVRILHVCFVEVILLLKYSKCKINIPVSTCPM